MRNDGLQVSSGALEAEATVVSKKGGPIMEADSNLVPFKGTSLHPSPRDRDPRSGARSAGLGGLPKDLKKTPAFSLAMLFPAVATMSCYCYL